MAKPPVRLDHVARLVPPWRTPHLTECRKELSKVVWLTREQLLEKVKSQGRWTAATTCRVCLEAVTRWTGEWDAAPDTVIERDLYNTRAWHESKHRLELRLELWALAELVRRHPEEFAQLCSQFGAPPPDKQRVGLRVVPRR